MLYELFKKFLWPLISLLTLNWPQPRSSKLVCGEDHVKIYGFAQKTKTAISWEVIRSGRNNLCKYVSTLYRKN